jgi:uncharacterized membrane protein YdbT with pleckstrin-like domain
MAKDQKKQFRGQYDDEEVLYAFRKHPVVMRKGLILFMLAILLGTVPSFIKPELSYFYGGIAAGFLLGFLLAFPSWVYWYFSVYIVTDKRFVQTTQKGLFHKKVVDIAINQIQMVNYEVAGIQETLLGFGTIMIQTMIGDLVIHDVHKPAHVQHELLGLLRERGIAVHGSNMSNEPETEDNEEE